MDLPSSLVTPMNACPALRPRWGPLGTAADRENCCLPDSGKSLAHNDKIISGLHLAACILDPPGFVLGLLLRTQDSLPACQRALAGWDFLPTPWQGTHWVTSTGFKTHVPIPPSRAFLGANLKDLGGRKLPPPRSFPLARLALRMTGLGGW